jgi:hypothetical protein
LKSSTYPPPPNLKKSAAHHITLESPRIYGRMAWGGHGLPQVSLGPYPSRPCERPPLKRPYKHFKGGRRQGRQPAAVFYPLGHPTPYALHECEGAWLWAWDKMAENLHLAIKGKHEVNIRKTLHMGFHAQSKYKIRGLRYLQDPLGQLVSHLWLDV